MLTTYRNSAYAAFSSDMYCGPRCVHRVLQHLGEKSDVGDIVTEMKTTAQAAPISLLAIKRVLSIHGVDTIPFRLHQWNEINGSCLCVIHIQNEDGSGHFAVLFPESQNGRQLWSWPEGTITFSDEDVRLAGADFGLAIVPQSMKSTSIEPVQVSWHFISTTIFVVVLGAVMASTCYYAFEFLTSPCCHVRRKYDALVT